MFDDVNGNGQLDSGESGLAGITLSVTLAGRTELVETDSDGLYEATDLVPGTYTVRVTNAPDDTFAVDDFDGVNTPDVAQVPVNRADVVDVNFAYRGMIFISSF